MSSSAKSRFRVLFCLLVGFGVGAANLFKPVHIDDTAYIAIAKWIAEHPTDPFGGTYNWNGTEQSNKDWSRSPPLLSYYFAGVMKATRSDSPLILHASMIPWTVLCAWSLARISQSWTRGSVLPALAILVSPAFVVGQNLMLDVPMLASCCASIAFGCIHVETKSLLAAFLAAFFASVAVMIKYPALVLIPYFVVAAFAYRRPVFLVTAILPAAAFAGFLYFGVYVYQASPEKMLQGFALNQAGGILALLKRGAENTFSLCCIFAMTSPLWLISLRVKGQRGTAAFLTFVVFALMAAVVAFAPKWEVASFWKQFKPALRERPIVWTTFLLMSLGGLMALVDAFLRGFISNARELQTAADDKLIGEYSAIEEKRHGMFSRFSLLILAVSAWIFVVFIGDFVATRSTLLIAVPVSFLLFRQVVNEQESRALAWRCLGYSVALSGLLLWTDFRWAKGYQEKVDLIVKDYGSRNEPVYFTGHWGFQFYAERAGFYAWDEVKSELPPNALFLEPMYCDAKDIRPDIRMRLKPLETLSVDEHPLALSTCDRRNGINFYYGELGQIPWGFSRGNAEELRLSETSKLRIPKSDLDSNVKPTF